MGSKALDQVVGQIAGFKTAKSQAVEIGHPCAQGLDQIRQGFGRLSVLSSAQRSGLAVGAQENPRQNDLTMTGIDQRLGFFDAVVNRLAPERRSKLWDDAVGAMRVTAILDLQESALVMQPGDRRAWAGSAFR